MICIRSIAVFVTCLSVFLVCGNPVDHSGLYSLQLDPEGHYKIQWSVDYSQEIVKFQLTAKVMNFYQIMFHYSVNSVFPWSKNMNSIKVSINLKPINCLYVHSQYFAMTQSFSPWREPHQMTVYCYYRLAGIASCACNVHNFRFFFNSKMAQA